MRKLRMAAIMIAVGAVQAQAGTISVQPASGVLETFRTPTSGQANDVIPGLWGYLNGDLVLNGNLGTKYLVTFTLVDAESGWTNQLRETDGNTVLVEQADNNKSISYLHTASGGPNDYLKFQFETIAGATQPILVNGPAPAGNYIANGGTGSLRTFYVSFCIDTAQAAGAQQNLGCNSTDLDGAAGIQTPTAGNIAWIALDDSGAGPNDNHDDWVGYVRVSAVPDGGATAGLLSAALLGLGIVRRRFGV